MWMVGRSPNSSRKAPFSISFPFSFATLNQSSIRPVRGPLARNSWSSWNPYLPLVTLMTLPSKSAFQILVTSVPSLESVIVERVSSYKAFPAVSTNCSGGDMSTISVSRKPSVQSCCAQVMQRLASSPLVLLQHPMKSLWQALQQAMPSLMGFTERLCSTPIVECLRTAMHPWPSALSMDCPRQCRRSSTSSGFANSWSCSKYVSLEHKKMHSAREEWRSEMVAQRLVYLGTCIACLDCAHSSLGKAQQAP
mmetsp:Transcript_46021/g.106258  ORF Transcript_46021/g.106258 Transcript_46021/m.106258 type:complete len:251 (-) Transcript_46021:12-764(-)